MTLTQQFLVISLLPLSFLGLVVYTWRGGQQRQELQQWWTIVLSAAAVWASSILRFYGGATFPISVKFTWGIVGKYALVITAVALLFTTFSHLAVPKQHGRFAFGLSLFLAVAAFLIDYEIWPYQLPELTLAGSSIRLFDISMAVWIASWLVPSLAAWMLSRQVKAGSPPSRYRNQINYWLIVLALFMIGAGLASVQQTRQPLWQEAGLLVILLAAFTGTISLDRRQLPDLQVVLRQLFSRLSGSLIVFGLTWWALAAIVRGVTNLPANTSPNLVLFLAALLFAGFFTLIYRFINQVTHRLFMPGKSRRHIKLADYQADIGPLPEPSQLADLTLHIVRKNLNTNDAWFFAVEDGPRDQLVLRPLANLNNYPLEAASFSGSSPFVAYLRANQTPLIQYDIEALHNFAQLPADEKAVLDDWKRVVYMPLHGGDNLVGVLALGQKNSGEPYDRQDFEQLQSLAAEFGPLLVHAQSIANLRQINNHLFAQNTHLAHEKQHLQQLLALFNEFGALVSSDLKRPFTLVNSELETLQSSLKSDRTAASQVAAISRQLQELEAKLTRLVIISSKLQGRGTLDIAENDIDTIIQQAIYSLKTMADARRVEVQYEAAATTLAVMSDARQLQEAIHLLLHNAIKYNKIGGAVQINYVITGDQVCINIRDTGVGIPEERLETIG
ncbi:MAG: GAF domain-containing protein, partial [Anaerolineae bacterium]